MENLRKLLTVIFTMCILATFSACTDSEIASRNLSKAAEMFQINRRIIFYDSINSEYMLSIEGRCSIKVDGVDNQLEVTCKDSETSYKKHFLGISDNVTYFAEQLGSADVDVYHYKVIFKPKTFIPDVDLIK